MFYAQYFMLFLKIHMSVYLGGYNRTVTKKVLNISYIYIFFQQQSGKRVAKGVWSNMLLNPCFCSQMTNEPSDGLRSQFPPQSIDEK